MSIFLSIIALLWLFYLSGRVTDLEARFLLSEPKKDVPQGEEVIAENSEVTTTQYLDTIMHTTPQKEPEKQAETAVEKTMSTPVRSGEEEGARWLGIIGIAALVVGVGLFFKYAIENNLISPVMQIALFALVGVGLIIAGLLPRLRNELLGGLLAGGGFAVLYLTIFAAHTDYYSLITESFTTLALYACVAIVAFVIGLLTSMPALLITSLFGLFIAPYLSGKEIFDLLPWYSTLFSLILIVTSYIKKWDGLVFLGFMGFVIHFQSWLFVSERADILSLVFLGGSAVLYSAYVLIQSLRSNEGNGETLLLAWVVPCLTLASGCLQVLDRKEYGMFALIIAFVYVLYTLTLFAEKKIFDSFVANHAFIAGFFFVLFVPLQWSDEKLVFGWLFLGVIFSLLGYTIKKYELQIVGFLVSLFGIVYALVSGYLFVSNTEAPLFNTRASILIPIIVVSYLYVYLYSRKEQASTQLAQWFLIISQVATVWLLTTEIYQSYFNRGLHNSSYYYNSYYSNSTTNSLKTQADTTISSVWGLYALALVIVGFTLRQKILRLLGLTLFFITALWVFGLIWNIGGIWRAVGSIAFAALALLSSFIYTKYKDRL